MDLPNSGIEPESPAFQVGSLLTELLGKPTEFCMVLYILLWWPGTPDHSQLVFCKHFCVRRCIPDVSMERDVLHIRLLFCPLVPLQHLFLNCWFLPSILSLFAPCVLMTLLLGTDRSIVFITSWWIRPFITVQCFSLFLVSLFCFEICLSDIYIATKAFVYLLHLFTFDIFVSLNVICVSCKEHTDDFFKIHFVTHYLLFYLLMYSWFTMLCLSLQYSKVTQIYTYKMFSFYISLTIFWFSYLINLHLMLLLK